MTSKTTNKFSPEVRARAIRMVSGHEAEHPSRWAAVSSIAAKIGCSAHTLHEWVKKAEVIHRRGPWRNFEAVEFAALEWVDWFNHRRLLEPIGNIPPAEAEEQYYAVLDAPAMAAYACQGGVRTFRSTTDVFCRLSAGV
jgi:transposase-like protein